MEIWQYDRFFTCLDKLVESCPVFKNNIYKDCESYILYMLRQFGAILYCFDLHIQKILWSKYTISYSLLFAITLLILSSPLVFLTSNQLSRAYAHEFRECDLIHSAQIETENNNNDRFEIEQDFEVDIEEEPETPEDVCEDSNAKDAKKLKLERGETITVDWSFAEPGGIEAGRICLADKDRSDGSIALDEGRCGADGTDIVRFDCGSPQEPQGACETGQFEVEIPDDIDKGKYKIVIGALNDIAELIISKVKIK